MSNRHKYYDVIVAWANGEDIQYFELGSEGWANYTPFGKNSIPAFNSEELKWRIKPKTEIKCYRMALFSITKGKHSVSAFDITNSTVDNPAEYNIQGFIRWVSDIVEVEIEV